MKRRKLLKKTPEKVFNGGGGEFFSGPIEIAFVEYWSSGERLLHQNPRTSPKQGFGLWIWVLIWWGLFHYQCYKDMIPCLLMAACNETGHGLHMAKSWRTTLGFEKVDVLGNSNRASNRISQKINDASFPREEPPLPRVRWKYFSVVWFNYLMKRNRLHCSIYMN